MSKLLESLAKLDVNNDEHWTTDGLPRLDALETIHGSSVSRADITAAAPKFNRKNTELGAPAPAAAPAAQAPQAATPAPSAPAATPAPQPAAPAAKGDDEQEELSDFDIADKELAAANAAYVKARARVNKATIEMDKLIRQREAEDAGRTGMADIKAFQRSQAAQRAAAARNADEVAAMLREKNLL